MAAPIRPSDRSLLDRLNALKPTSVTLDKSPNLITLNPGEPTTTNSGLGFAGQQPESREDALAARLRTLRAGRLDSESPSANADADANATQPLYNPQATGQKQKVSHDERNTLFHEGASNNSSSLLGPSGDPYLVEADDQEALDALLEVLDDFELSDSEFGAAGSGRTADEAAKLAGLLNKLRRDSTSSAATSGDQVPGEQSLHDDDSDGEHMTKEVESALSQLRDEIDLSAQTAEKGETPADASGAKGDDASNALSLPTVPSSQPLDLEPEPEPEPGTQDHRKSLDFENDITARLASLRGLGAGINTGSFGLPSAPTFRPEERSTSSPAAGALRKQAGYTDEDQKTWCIVCLDDATIRCTGCDDDVYCARCWKDMHFGPSAGYDERGHKWAKFVR
ncbi:hypothetical protein B0T25DRAFT_338220 [Lasiosphaeria hispida]|uniref:Abscission/NoCut checkpoint regulator n=1 Tax=Lasiosphaeria hispida TaxID=260671 RepID=A0AAJ0H676_9PEZI|nr:hypothetical protein B0T25DRAFT_338220 [Lasiosphaeria hispida]